MPAMQSDTIHREHRTRHEPSIPMFDQDGRRHGVSLDVEETREWSGSSGWTPWTPEAYTMRCEGEVVIQEGSGRYRLLHGDLLLHPPVSEQ